MGRPLQHRRRIKMALVAALALDVGVALVTTGVASAAPTAAPRASDNKVATAKAKAFAKLKIMKDGVSVKRKGKSVFAPAHDGQKLRVGDTIQTDATGEAEIDYTVSANSFTRLDVSTTFTIKHLTDNQGHRQVEGTLDSGRTWNRTSALTESESFSQDGAGATASVVGSAFVAECDTAGHCTFTSVVDGLKLVTIDGDVKVLTPLEACDSTELNPQDANLCGVPVQVTADVLAANAWIQQNLFFDGKAGFPGPTITGTVVVTNGVVTFTPTPTPDTTPAATEPGAPTNVSAKRGDGSADVSWSAPASDGGSPITGYTVTATNTTITSASVAPMCTWTTGTLSCTVAGLNNGDSYTFTVTATNIAGTSAPSDPSNEVTPASVPDAPTIGSATAGDGTAHVTFSAPGNDGGSSITGYTVTSSEDDTCTAGPSATSCDFSGLTNGTAYTFTVVATNVAGDSAPSGASNSVTPSAAPTIASPTPALDVLDETNTNFTLNGSEPTAGINWAFLFDTLPDAQAGTIYASSTAVDTATQYAPDTQFTFSAADPESAEVTPLVTNFSYHAVNQNGQTSTTANVPVTVTDCGADDSC